MATTTTSSSNMDPASLAALQSLIASLSSNTNAGVNKQASNIQSEIATNTANRNAYSKDAAFADATGAVNANISQVLQQLLPSLTRSAEGSGTSQNSLRALMTQQAATQAAQSGATVGLNAAAAYGGVSNQLSSVLANLVSQQDPATKALLDALSVAKEAVSSSTQTTPNSGMVLPSSGGVVGPSYSLPTSSSSSNMMSGVFGQSDTQVQLDSLTKQLGLAQQLASMSGSDTSNYTSNYTF